MTTKLKFLQEIRLLIEIDQLSKFCQPIKTKNKLQNLFKSC